jgi:site-specific DNA-cytosine methylase
MPEFVEWMLGFPNGWTEGVSRTQRLKMLGNAVQVECAELVGIAVARTLKATA